MQKFILVLILTVASILRLWDLSVIPPSASLDEASIAYNAYSVLKTGGDEFGDFPFPSQRGYDDFRRSTYLLISIPFVAVFGLSTIAIRLPAAILSILTVWAVFYIVRELFDKKSRHSFTFATISALLLAISPWHIYISHLGHESNASFSFFVFGVLFFLKGIRNSKFLLISAIFFTFSMISYYSGQLFIPLFVTSIFIIFRKKIFPAILSNTRSKIISLLAVIGIVPILFAIFSPDALIRYRGTSVLNPQVHPERFDEFVKMRNKAVEQGDFIGSILFNRRVFFAKVLVENYLSHFRPSWLFSASTNDAFKAPFTGLLYPWQLPFILLGAIAFIKSRKFDRKIKFFVFLWFALGPLPATIATQAPHAMRAYNMLPVWQFLTALGITYLLFRFKRFQYLVGLLVVVIAFYSFFGFLKNYFVEFARLQSKSYQYALSQAVPYVIENEKKYDKVIFSNQDNLFQSYMIFLYHSKYDPVLYQRQGGTSEAGFDAIHNFGKYEFRPINWKNENKRNTLYIGNPSDFPDEIGSLKTFHYLDGTIGIKAVEKK